MSNFRPVKNSHALVTPVKNYFDFFQMCDKYVRIVKNSHLFVASVKIFFEFFTCVTNTCEFFTRLKLDICEKRVPIKISKLIVRTFHTYQKCDVFMRIIHSV